MERVRYDLLFVINTLTLAVACNSAVWAVLLCVSAHQHRVPFLGIQPSNVPMIGNLEHILGDHRSQDRDSQVEEEEVDWHEEDDPRAVQPVKKDKNPHSPTRVLELKLPVPTQ